MLSMIMWYSRIYLCFVADDAGLTCVKCCGRLMQDCVCVWSVVVDRRRTVCVECGGRLLRQRLT